jgi:hypothetical protein
VAATDESRGPKKRFDRDAKKSGYDKNAKPGSKPRFEAKKTDPKNKKHAPKPTQKKSGYVPRPVKKPSKVATLLKKLVFWK